MGLEFGVAVSAAKVAPQTWDSQSWVHPGKLLLSLISSHSAIVLATNSYELYDVGRSFDSHYYLLSLLPVKKLSATALRSSARNKHACSADEVRHEDSDGLAPWPRLDMGCLYEEPAMPGVPYRLGHPCLEGGSVAIRRIETRIGIWNCMVLYGRQGELLPQQDSLTTDSHPDVLALQTATRQIVRLCLPSPADVVDTPVPLAHYASCIANVNMHNALEDLHIPIRGVAVLPYKAGPRPNVRLTAVYSDFIDAYGHIEADIKTISIRLTANSEPQIAFFDMRIVILIAT